jgi:hypothetical protein
MMKIGQFGKINTLKLEKIKREYPTRVSSSPSDYIRLILLVSNLRDDHSSTFVSLSPSALMAHGHSHSHHRPGERDNQEVKRIIQVRELLIHNRYLPLFYLIFLSFPSLFFLILR